MLKTGPDYYDVCGAWECGMAAEGIRILGVIEKPKDHESTPLYYID